LRRYPRGSTSRIARGRANGEDPPLQVVPLSGCTLLSKKIPIHSRCGNCFVALVGPYCHACGQHSHESARSVAALFHDAWHIATHVDDRFWQTLYALLLRPGVLTREYFAERRARYLPPVRLYLVLSVLFFAFGAFSPHKMGADFEGVRVAPQVGPTEQGWNTFLDGLDCSKVHSGVKWLGTLIQDSCRRNIHTHGEGIVAVFIEYIPKMMFVFVPLMALAMLILYWRPRRYYVEHLVFFLHNHAAVFLILLLETLLAWLGSLYAFKSFGSWVVAFTSLYMLWYLYRAMRVYYGQGRWLTITKLLVVGLTYLIAIVVTLLMTLFVSALMA
jgi:hypothetical protein